MESAAAIVQAGKRICDSDEFSSIKRTEPECAGSTAGNGGGQGSDVGVAKSPDIFLQLQCAKEIRDRIQLADQEIRFGSEYAHESFGRPIYVRVEMEASRGELVVAQREMKSTRLSFRMASAMRNLLLACAGSFAWASRTAGSSPLKQFGMTDVWVGNYQIEPLPVS